MVLQPFITFFQLHKGLGVALRAIETSPATNKSVLTARQNTPTCQINLIHFRFYVKSNRVENPTPAQCAVSIHVST